MSYRIVFHRTGLLGLFPDTELHTASSATLSDAIADFLAMFEVKAGYGYTPSDRDTLQVITRHVAYDPIPVTGCPQLLDAIESVRERMATYGVRTLTRALVEEDRAAAEVCRLFAIVTADIGVDVAIA